MHSFRLVPEIRQYDTTKEFCADLHIGMGDLLLISESLYDKFFKLHDKGAIPVFYRKYGSGEPTDLMVEGIYRDLQGLSYQRVIAVGGGMILVPTTCGTGSEVTNISILELTAKNTKLGLADDALFADKAVLIPELLKRLPLRFFATSSIDALIHSIESFTSPKANAFTRMYSKKAMTIILECYQYIVEHGPESRADVIGDLLTASTYAGIAFGNAGCAAVHAMSYPLGAAYHVPHGEANYAMFTGVYKTYLRLQPEGVIAKLNEHLAYLLGCTPEHVYDELETLLNHLIPKKPLHEYGMTEADIDSFTHTVMTKQGRLMANNYTTLDEDTVRGIYKELF